LGEQIRRRLDEVDDGRRTRALLEELAFGDRDDVRAADRLRAAEMLEAAGKDYDERAVDIARILDG